MRFSGGRANTYEDEADTGSSEALAELQEAAEKLGANAVVGAAYAVYGIGNNGSMMLVTLSGTAVVVE